MASKGNDSSASTDSELSPVAGTEVLAGADLVSSISVDTGTTAGTGSTDPKSCLAKHNEYRLKRSLKPLVWDKGLESDAQSWANEKEGVMMHSSGTGQGENLYSGEGGCLSAVTLWMAEGPSSLPSYVVTENNYLQIGHYSQVLWKTTRKLGCGQAHGLVVCRYHPPGNMLGNKIF